ncbi:hypothetical protein KAU45_01650 [bacterium]|nr:hypothetical protein [bacterium]
MRRVALVILLAIITFTCYAGEVPPPDPAVNTLIESENLSITPWHWYSVPVIRPGGSLYLGFMAKNPTGERVTAEYFWGCSELTLVSPSNEVQTVPGTRMLEVGEYIKDMEPGGRDTAVVKIEDLFTFTEVGPHILRWETPFGVMDYIIGVMDGLDYLFYRLENDVSYNEWGVYLYGEDGMFLSNSLAYEVVSYKEEATEGLVPFLDNGKECFIEGSEEATIGSMYAHRLKDYAAIMLAEIGGLDIPELRAMDPVERNAGIEKVRSWLEESVY